MQEEDDLDEEEEDADADADAISDWNLGADKVSTVVFNFKITISNANRCHPTLNFEYTNLTRAV